MKTTTIQQQTQQPPAPSFYAPLGWTSPILLLALAVAAVIFSAQFAQKFNHK